TLARGQFPALHPAPGSHPSTIRLEPAPPFAGAGVREALRSWDRLKPVSSGKEVMERGDETWCRNLVTGTWEVNAGVRRHFSSPSSVTIARHPCPFRAVTIALASYWYRRR